MEKLFPNSRNYSRLSRVASKCDALDTRPDLVAVRSLCLCAPAQCSIQRGRRCITIGQPLEKYSTCAKRRHAVISDTMLLECTFSRGRNNCIISTVPARSRMSPSRRQTRATNKRASRYQRDQILNDYRSKDVTIEIEVATFNS